MTVIRTFLVGAGALFAFAPLMAGAATCPSFTYNLYFGKTDAQTGGQVTELQKFLGVEASGYYGPATEDAVERWQAAHGVASSGTANTTGYGAVGPTTRDAISASCRSSGGTTTTNTSSSASTGSTATSNTSGKTPSITLSATPASVASGKRAALSWSVTNARRCVLKYGSTEESVSLRSIASAVYPKTTTTYTLWCAADGGTGKDGPSASKSVTVSVSGSSSSSSSSSGSSSSDSSNSSSQTSTSSSAPTCTLTSSKSSIAVGETARLTWTSTNATVAIIGEGIGSVNSNDSVVIAPLRTTTYTFAVQGSGGKKYCTTTVRVSTEGSSSNLSACTNATRYRGETGSFSCSCKGNFSLTGVWGSSPYTDDSNICAAALHAGVINENGGNVTFTLGGSHDSYSGSSKNGVTTNSYGDWNWSYTVSRGPTAFLDFSSSLAAASASLSETFAALGVFFGAH